MPVHKMYWVDEVQPTVVQHGDWENPDERVEFHDVWLTEKARALLVELADQYFDAGTCESNSACGQPIGYSQSGEADEILTWHWTTVVYRGDEVLLVCEECSPTNLYPVPKEPS